MGSFLPTKLLETNRLYHFGFEILCFVLLNFGRDSLFGVIENPSCSGIFSLWQINRRHASTNRQNYALLYCQICQLARKFC